MNFSIKDFFSKGDQIRRKLHRKLRIWSHLLKKSFMENFIFCAKLGFNDSTSLIVTDYELIILFNNNWFQTLYFRNYCQTYQLHLHQFTRFVYFLLVLAITFLSIEVLRKIRIFLDCFRKSLSNIFQGCSQNFNQVPQNFMKVFNVDNVTLIS